MDVSLAKSVTLAEALRHAGYRTGAFVASTVLGPDVNLTQGFEEVHRSPGPWLGSSFGAGLLRRHMDRFRPGEAPPPDLAGLAAGWLRRHREDDFFLWVHFFDPHAPYGPPRSYMAGRQPPAGGKWRFEGWDEEAIRDGTWVPTLAERNWIRQLYQGEVRYVDDFAGRLLAELKSLGLYDDTFVVLLSDHGEEFWEHAGYGHGHTLYDELLHVPFLLKLPRAAHAGPIDVPVSTASLMPTVLGLCNLALPSGYPAEPSLLPLLRGDRTAAPAPLLSLGLNRFEDRRAIRFGRFKYIRWDLTGREEASTISPAIPASGSISRPSPAPSWPRDGASSPPSKRKDAGRGGCRDSRTARRRISTRTPWSGCGRWGMPRGKAGQDAGSQSPGVR